MCQRKTKKARTTSPKKTTSKKKSSGFTRSQGYGEFKGLGTRVAAESSFSPPVLDKVDGLRLNFLDRALDEETGELVKDSTFGSRYRSTHDAQDELFSTASTRSFIQGLLNGQSKDTIPKEKWQQWTEAVDLLSRLRIPTKYSGFATSSGILQHPTEVGEGFFSTAAVAGQHGSLDSARVKYVGASVKQAREAGKSVYEQFLTAARAAIEFSLNYFTAPITAKNVQPFSTKSGVEHTDKALQDQLASRERIKDIYVKLGGKLRDLSEEETLEESWARSWQSGITISTSDPYPIAPPSPLRVNTKKRKQPEPSITPPTKVALTGVTAKSLHDVLGEDLFEEDALFDSDDVLPENLAEDDLFFSLAVPSSSFETPWNIELPSSLVTPSAPPEELLEDDPYISAFTPSAPPLEEPFENAFSFSNYSPSAPLEESFSSSYFSSIYEPSAPPLELLEDDISSSVFAPSAPPLSEDPFTSDFSINEYSSNFEFDDPIALDEPLNAFNLQTNPYTNYDQFELQFPEVPTHIPGGLDDGEILPDLPDVPVGGLDGAVGVDGAVATESVGEGAEALLLLA